LATLMLVTGGIGFRHALKCIKETKARSILPKQYLSEHGGGAALVYPALPELTFKVCGLLGKPV
jgi:hypothetical protein